MLTRVYKDLRTQNSDSKWWNRGIKILAIIFGFMGFGTFIVGYSLYFSIYEYEDDFDFQNYNAETQRYMTQGTYVFGTLFVLSSVIPIMATVGLPLHRRFGGRCWISDTYPDRSCRGPADKERATYFVMSPVIAKQFYE